MKIEAVLVLSLQRLILLIVGVDAARECRAFMAPLVVLLTAAAAESLFKKATGGSDARRLLLLDEDDAIVFPKRTAGMGRERKGEWPMMVVAVAWFGLEVR